MKSNIQTRKLITDLNKSKEKIWKRIASELEKPTRNLANVNIYKIDKTLREGETAIVPGKVLSLGNLTKKTTIAAFQFSDAAKAKINKNGEAITIKELLTKNPKGSKVRIIK